MPWVVRRSRRALERSKRLESERLAAAAKAEEDLAMAWRYFVATRVRVSRAESWVDLKPTYWQICETAILATAKQKSDGDSAVGLGVAIVGGFDFDFGFGFGFDFMVGFCVWRSFR